MCSFLNILILQSNGFHTYNYVKSHKVLNPLDPFNWGTSVAEKSRVGTLH